MKLLIFLIVAILSTLPLFTTNQHLLGTWWTVVLWLLMCAVYEVLIGKIGERQEDGTVFISGSARNALPFVWFITLAIPVLSFVIHVYLYWIE